MKHLLVIEDDMVDQMAFERFTKKNDFPFTYELVNSIKDAKKALKNNTYDAVVSDYFLGDGTTFEILDLQIDIPIVVVTGTGSEEIAVNALKKGAFDYLIKDVDGYYLRTLVITVQNAIHRFNTQKELNKYHQKLEELVEERTIELKKEIEVRKKTEISLKKLSTAVEQSPAIITITDLKGNIEYVNPKFTETSGYSLKEVIGKKANLLKSGEHPAEFYKNLWNTILTGNNFRCEICNKKKDGTLFWESAIISSIKNDKGNIRNFLKVAENITQKKEITTALKLSEQNLRKAQEIAQMGSFNLDLKTNLGVCSDTFFNLTELEKVAYLKFSEWRKLIHPDDIETNNKILKKTIESGDKYNHEFRIITKNTQTLKWVQGIGEVNLKENKFKGVIQDITERKLFEQKLVIALEKATESDRLKTAFLHNISHEIRTPMNGILGFTDLLTNSDLSNEKQQKYIEIISKSSKRLLNTVNNIMDISKLETGQTKLQLGKIDVNKVLLNFYEFYKLEVEAKGIELSLNIENKNEELILHNDLAKFEEILTNLLKNATKYSNQGSIQFGYNINNKKVEFYVKDTGMGIPKNRQKAIFDRFVQADIEDKNVHEGSGLGLSISKAYVEMMQGEIWVNSEEGKGSTFYFTLPITTDIKEHSKPKKASSTKTKLTLPKKINILIAEDDDYAFQYLNIVLDGIFNNLYRATTGEEAVEICKNHPDLDLILMDVKMPVMNGYEATKYIRNFNKDIIIIAQTAYALMGNKEQAFSAGCNEYISKPIKKTKLIKLLEHYFKK
jgi:PAS domain S-box-containing protein